MGKKSMPFILKYGRLGPTSFKIWDMFTILGVYMNNISITIQIQSQVGALVAKKSMPLIFAYGPLGLLTFVFGIKMVISCHPCNIFHKCAKFEPWGYFSFWSTEGQGNFNWTPPGPLTFYFGTKMVIGFILWYSPQVYKVWVLRLLKFLRYRGQRSVLRRRRRRKRRPSGKRRISMPCFTGIASINHGRFVWSIVKHYHQSLSVCVFVDNLQLPQH